MTFHEKTMHNALTIILSQGNHCQLQLSACKLVLQQIWSLYPMYIVTADKISHQEAKIDFRTLCHHAHKARRAHGHLMIEWMMSLVYLKLINQERMKCLVIFFCV